MINSLIGYQASQPVWAEDHTTSARRVGSAAAALGDLVLLHYVGTLEDGTTFDSTRGGLVSHADLELDKLQVAP